MAYATQADLVPARLSLGDLIELTSDAGNLNIAALQAAFVDPSTTTDPNILAILTVVQAALDKASATVDAYCGQRYQTPLQLSVLVVEITVDLALFELAKRRRDTRPNETWTEAKDMAMKLLADVSNGRASLDQPVNATAPQTSSADVTVTHERQRFDDRNLRGFC
jgi:phage gp36-like protein